MTTEPNPPGAAERIAAVERVREGWIRRLVDLSRRNNLLYYRDLKTGTLDLTLHDPEAMAQLLADAAVPVTKLLPGSDADATGKSLQEIRRRAQANLEERGLNTLFIAMHMATWPATDTGRPPEAAVLLLPVQLIARGRDGRTFAVQRAGDVQVNLVLLQALETAAGVRLEPEALLGEDPEADRFAGVLDRLRAAAADLPGFAVNPRFALGNFAFAKMAMVRDLRDQAAAFARHDLIAAIAGVPEAREAVRSVRREVNTGAFDGTDPGQEFFVLDADSSQQAVVVASVAGQDGVIQGPPGTGKSQTIVNLIASLAAEGKRVLFVAEKRAALDVVLKRLERAGLGHLALDLHSADISRRQVMERVAQSLAAVREALPVADQSVHGPLIDRRNRLNLHRNRMHAVVAPSERSVYDLQGELLRFPDEAHVSTRWRGAALDALSEPRVRDIVAALGEATGFGDLFLRSSPSPWNGANLPDGTAARQARDLAVRLANTEWPALRDAFTQLRGATGLPEPATIDALLAAVAASGRVAEVQRTYRPELFAQDLGALGKRLQPARGNAIAHFFAKLFNGGYKSATKTARGLRTSSAGPKTLIGEVEAAAGVQSEWQRLAPGVPVPAMGGNSTVSGAAAAFTASVETLAPMLGGRPLRSLTPVEFEAAVNGLAADSLTPDRIPRLLEIERAIGVAGAADIIAELRRVQPPTELWAVCFAFAWASSLLDRAREADPSIAGFNGRVHDRAVDEFVQLDRKRLEVATARVRRAHAERAVAAMNTFPEQDALVRREAEKKTRHLPLRRLLAEAPDVLTTLCPCWMASPLTVAQLLDANRRYFDVVVFDEASQVLPEDAACSLVRAKHAVVAGDSRQLPPTTFFAAGDADDDGDVDDGDATAGFESLLDLMRGFLEPWTLRWHYRSRDETLIAFSNRYIYESQLVTFPGPGGPPVVRHELVQSAGSEEDVDSAGAEVRRVVELVLAHAEQRPKETLGVIAMGIKHAQRVQDAIDDALQSRPELDAFFDQSADERFFVKNLERVQGDERDAIILTVGYGKDANGRLPYRFGPLLTDGGERRLNVAVTRARRRVTLVSSFSHLDMDPGRSTARGVELLREYIAYAAAGGHASTAASDAAGLTPFEQDVKEALEAAGLQVVPHWGASNYRIDFAVRNPDDPERFILAVECDGPTYQSVPTARDRDRLRRQVLEGLGWRFLRIWSTDWYQRRDEEIGRVVSAYQAALAALSTPPPAQPAAATAAPAGAAPLTAAPAEPPQPERPLPRPRVRKGKSIDEYTQRELIGLVRWITSDGRMRTDEELLDEMVQELGFSRRGTRIEAAIRAAIAAAGP
ncbi:MAG: DUF4011 domain-containing protein [Dehalococcoidia bacterium]|nr:DUF4011 domain-containing protein [Dehalococcoidia bacterium]